MTKIKNGYVESAPRLVREHTMCGASELVTTNTDNVFGLNNVISRDEVPEDKALRDVTIKCPSYPLQALLFSPTVVT